MVRGMVQVLYRYGYVKVEGVGSGCDHSTVIVTDIVVVRVVGMVRSGAGAWCWLCYGYGMGCGDGYGFGYGYSYGYGYGYSYGYSYR